MEPSLVEKALAARRARAREKELAREDNLEEKIDLILAVWDGKVGYRDAAKTLGLESPAGFRYQAASILRLAYLRGIIELRRLPR